MRQARQSDLAGVGRLRRVVADHVGQPDRAGGVGEARVGAEAAQPAGEHRERDLGRQLEALQVAAGAVGAGRVLPEETSRHAGHADGVGGVREVIGVVRVRDDVRVQVLVEQRGTQVAFLVREVLLVRQVQRLGLERLEVRVARRAHQFAHMAVPHPHRRGVVVDRERVAHVGQRRPRDLDAGAEAQQVVVAEVGRQVQCRQEVAVARAVGRLGIRRVGQGHAGADVCAETARVLIRVDILQTDVAAQRDLAYLGVDVELAIDGGDAFLDVPALGQDVVVELRQQGRAREQADTRIKRQQAHAAAADVVLDI